MSHFRTNSGESESALILGKKRRFSFYYLLSGITAFLWCSPTALIFFCTANCNCMYMLIFCAQHMHCFAWSTVIS